MRVPSWAVLFGVVVSLSPGVLGQQPTTPPPLTELNRYLATVRGHSPGAKDASVRVAEIESQYRLRRRMGELGVIQRLVLGGRVSPSSKVNLEVQSSGGAPASLVTAAVTMPEVAVLLGVPPRSLDAAVGGVIASALVLHTDAAIAAFDRYDDGAVEQQLDCARALSQLLERDSKRKTLARVWALATGGILTLRYPRAAEEVLSSAVRAFPEDGEVHLARGALAETEASSPLQEAAALRAERRQQTTGRLKSDLDTPDAYYRTAITEYRRALALRPDLVEARLRLGRVLGLTGHDAESQRELVSVLSDANVFIAYNAHLFLGSLAERRRDTGEAEKQYRQALGVVPDAHGARLALSHVLEMADHRQDAMDALARAGGSDPWRDYLAGPARRAPDYLRDLFAAVQAARGREGGEP